MDLETALDASVQAGDEARAVGGPDEAAHHFQQALELLADPRRVAGADLDVSRLVVKAAEALVASGHTRSGRRRWSATSSDRLPDDAPPAWFARMLAVRSTALAYIETDEDPADVSAEALALVPDDAHGLRAKVLGVHARSRRDGPLRGGAGVGLDALELAELDLNELVSDAITTLSRLKKAGPKESLRAALADAIARARETGALEAELRGRYMLGRSYEDWASSTRPRSGSAAASTAGGMRRSVGAVRLRVALAAHLGAARPGRLGRGARALRRARPGAAAHPAGAAGEPAGDHRVRPRGRRVRRARRAASLLAPRGGIAIHAAAVAMRQAGRRGGRRPCWRRTTTRCGC